MIYENDSSDMELSFENGSDSKTGKVGSISHISNKSLFSNKNNLLGYKPIPKEKIE